MQPLYRMLRFGVAGLFRVPVLAALLVSAALAAGCDRGGAAGTASPRAAAKAYVVAMNTGDADTLAAISHGDDLSLKLLVSVARSNAAYSRLEQVAGQRFGDPKSVFAYPRARDHYGQLQKQIDTAEEQVHGTSASIGKGLASVHLTKVNGQWKVDLAQHVPPGTASASDIALSDAFAQAYGAVADGITAGKFGTAEEAKAVLMGKTQAAVMPLIQTPARVEPSTTAPVKPTSSPATGPASAP